MHIERVTCDWSEIRDIDAWHTSNEEGERERTRMICYFGCYLPLLVLIRSFSNFLCLCRQTLTRSMNFFSFENFLWITRKILHTFVHNQNGTITRYTTRFRWLYDFLVLSLSVNTSTTKKTEEKICKCFLAPLLYMHVSCVVSLRIQFLFQLLLLAFTSLLFSKHFLD